MLLATSANIFLDRATLGDVIRQQRELHELSLRQLARLTGISNPYLSQIERGLRDPSDHRGRLARRRARPVDRSALHRGRIRFRRWYRRARGVLAAIAADSLLRPAQRRALIETYQAFVVANGGSRPRRRGGDVTPTRNRHRAADRLAAARVLAESGYLASACAEDGPTAWRTAARLLVRSIGPADRTLLSAALERLRRTSSPRARSRSRDGAPPGRRIETRGGGSPSRRRRLAGPWRRRPPPATVARRARRAGSSASTPSPSPATSPHCGCWTADARRAAARRARPVQRAVRRRRRRRRRGRQRVSTVQALTPGAP